MICLGFFLCVFLIFSIVQCLYKYILHNLGQMPGNRIIGNELFGAAHVEGKDDNSTPGILVYLVVYFGGFLVVCGLFEMFGG